MTKKIVKTSIILISLILLASTALASTSIEVSEVEENEVLWEEAPSDINVDLICSEGEPDTLSLNDELVKEDFDGETEVEIQLEEQHYGDNELKLDCDGEQTSSDSFDFDFNYLETFSFEEYTEDPEYYNGERLEIQTVFEFADSDYELEEDNIDLEEMDIRGTSQELENIESVEVNGNDVVFGGEVPSSSDIDPGTEDIVTEIEYNGISQSTTTSEPFEIKDRWEFTTLQTNVTEQNTIELQEFEEFQPFKEIEVREKGEIQDGNDISSNDFYIESEDTDTTGSLDVIYRDSIDGFEISFSAVPDLDIGEYTFEIGIEDGEEKEKIEEFIVLNYISFEGRILDHHEDGVDTEFEIIGDSDAWNDIHAGTKEIDGEHGNYQGSILPDHYNLSMTFEENVNFEMFNTDLTEDGQQNINYDTIPSSNLEDEVEGVNIVKSVGILYGYNFDNGQATIDYEHGDVTEENARIMQCKEWYMSRECESGWERMDKEEIEVNPTAPNVKFPVEPQTRENDSYLMSGYALVENTDLVSDIELSSDRVPLGEDVQFEGDVETPEGESVSEVEVTIQIIDGDEIKSEQNTETNENGVFGVTVPAPEEEGTFDVALQAEKEPYNTFTINETGIIDTYVERSVDLSGTDQIELPVGQTVEEDITIINDGQDDLEDVSMYLNGLSNDWYDIEDYDEELDEGSSTSATLTIEAPEDYFSEENLENENYEIEVTARSGGEEVNQILDGVATISNEHIYEEGDEPTTSSTPSFESPEMPTGDFLAAQSSLNISLALITVFTLVLATAVKKRKNESDNDRDNMPRKTGGGLTSSGTGVSRGASNRVRKPNISTVEDQKEEAQSSTNEHEEEEAGQVEERPDNNEDSKKENMVEQDDSSESEDKFSCGVCGESFDTESAKNLHKQAMH